MITRINKLLKPVGLESQSNVKLLPEALITIFADCGEYHELVSPFFGSNLLEHITNCSEIQIH